MYHPSILAFSELIDTLHRAALEMPRSPIDRPSASRCMNIAAFHHTSENTKSCSRKAHQELLCCVLQKVRTPMVHARAGQIVAIYQGVFRVTGGRTEQVFTKPCTNYVDKQAVQTWDQAQTSRLVAFVLQVFQKPVHNSVPQKRQFKHVCCV